MPYQPTEGPNAAFGAGTSPSPVSGHENVQPLAPPSQYDTGYEALEREQGAYQPGSMESMTDQISQGSDSDG